MPISLPAPPPPPDPDPDPEPEPVPQLSEPWSWTVAELGRHITASQQETLLARFRAVGFKDIRTWTYPPA